MARKNKSFEDRVSSADIRAKNALDTFEYVAEELEAAAAAAFGVVQEAENEVVRLREVRDSAFRHHAAHSERAARIRELVK
jgi:hypothetical protein